MAISVQPGTGNLPGDWAGFCDVFWGSYRVTDCPHMNRILPDNGNILTMQWDQKSEA
jgi:hypothetical protein